MTALELNRTKKNISFIFFFLTHAHPLTSDLPCPLIFSISCCFLFMSWGTHMYVYLISVVLNLWVMTPGWEVD